MININIAAGAIFKKSHCYQQDYAKNKKGQRLSFITLHLVTFKPAKFNESWSP